MPPRLGALIAIVLWGVSFVATKTALRDISPMTLVVSRFGIGIVVLLAHLRFKGLPMPRGGRTWSALAGMGFVGITLHMMLQAYGLTLTSAVKTGWLIGLIPLWSAVLSAAFLGERFGTWKVAGLAAGFCGTLLLISGGESLGSILALPSTRGDLLVLASTWTWAIYTVMGHGTLKEIGSARATAGAMLAGWAMMLPFYVAQEGWNEYERLTPEGWGALLFLGIGCSGLGYLFWYAALERVEAARVASLLYLEPLVTCAAAMILLDEPLRATTLAGGLIVMAGVAMVQRAPAGTEERSNG